jgi:ribosome-binding protein aMBF1 (putative translation factor)
MSTNLSEIDENSFHRYVWVMLTANQCRAARCWLGWSQADLSERAGVSLSTLRDFEGSKRTPIKNNLAAIQGAFEAEGIEFTFTESGEAVGIAVAATGQG